MSDWTRTCHPDIRLFLDYWQGKCGARAMPARGDIDPAEISRYLPYITLVDVVPDERRFVYRLVGTMEVELRGADPTGQSIPEAFFGRSAESVMLKYETVCRTRAPFYEIDDFQVTDRYVNEENLFVPLSDDGRTVNKIMVFSINRDLYTAADDTPADG
ncbi:PAS domain-containing protein [Dongia rigui]|uniref:PAS domain-containing protein n=1 Tax=Dongia rigui TaxID=940149 RepID=A0ABU5E2C7_9PROT|nr:PAS domain-containing protein [Dongia rigui]MDY0873624.1 PAS domain-containing protein [Dongia rigui]